MELTLKIEGMRCQNCVSHVRKALEAVPGLTLGSVEIGKVQLELQSATRAEVIALIEDEGYSIVP
ncbi:MAG: hypothetical protein RL318_251 [Fibrobacterota bacterium]|jgi:copper chaperone CopZ